LGIVDDWLTIPIRAAAGGSLVLAFAVLSEAVKPKRFAGLFSAAPAVAIAGLVVTLATSPSSDAQDGSLGMLAGVAGMVLYAAAVVALLKQHGAHLASAVAIIVWFVVAGALAVPLLV
jgi:uncharacterized membrane protein (GlpM family)